MYSAITFFSFILRSVLVLYRFTLHGFVRLPKIFFLLLVCKLFLRFIFRIYFSDLYISQLLLEQFYLRLRCSINDAKNFEDLINTGF